MDVVLTDMAYNAADGEVYSGRGSECDITVSSAKAYLNALNRMIRKEH